jgi:hypothetical protein
MTQKINNNNEKNKTPKIENTNKMSSMTFAIAASIAIVISISLGVINYTLNISSPANAILDTVAECKSEMLGYEQKGYYTGGALQFNEVVSYCSK